MTFSLELIWQVHYGYINIPHALKSPEGKDVGAFTVDRPDYHFHIGGIIIGNIKQITFINIGYNELKSGM